MTVHPSRARKRTLESPPASSLWMGQKLVHVAPGELFATAEPLAIATLLGSCVAVCLWDKVLGAGGMTHYLLSEGKSDKDLSPRYGNIAIPVLLEKLIRLGCHPGRLVAKVFGGGRVLKTLTGKNGRIGEQNITLAESTLAGMGIPIVGRDTGGTWGRKLVFFTKDGSVWVKNIGEESGGD